MTAAARIHIGQNSGIVAYESFKSMSGNLQGCLLPSCAIVAWRRLKSARFATTAGPRVVQHDNLKAAVVRACFYDPTAATSAWHSRHIGASPPGDAAAHTAGKRQTRS